MSETTTRSPTAKLEELRTQLSVVVPCFNAEKTLADQLDALCQQQWNGAWEVIVVNNRSTDRSMEIAKQYQTRFCSLRVVDALEKQGAAHAMNVGVHEARGEMIAFCDADDIVAEGWVAGMAEALAEHEFVSGPHEVDRLNTTDIQRSFGNAQPTGIQQYRDPPFLPHAGCGNMGVRRAVFNRLGGFDEEMPYLFDTDFCWKAQLNGVALAPAPKAILHIRYRDSLAGAFRQARRYGEYHVFIYKRYRPLGMPEYSLRRSLMAWSAILRTSRALLRPEQRGLWLWRLGRQVGRFVGCVKYRALAF